MKALLFVSFLILLVNSFETDVSLEGRDRIRIVSEFSSLPIIVVSSDNIPQGTASVIVGSGPSVQLNDVSSSVRGDFLEIRITGTEDFSEFSSSSDSSASSILKPFSCLVMISLVFRCFMGKRQYIIMVIALGLLATAYASGDQRIVVTFSLEESIQDLEISSPSSSVIVTPELVGDCTFGDDECWSMVCNVDDDDCISDQFVHIGVLLPLGGDKGDQYLQTLYLAANRYGTAVPLVQMIVADSGDSADGALAAARELVQHGCEYFVGPLFSGQAHEVLDYLEDQRKGKYSMISPEASSTELEQYDNFFSTFPENNDLAIAICQYSIYLMEPEVAEVIDMYIVGLETEYVDNLISLLGSECGIQFNLEFVEQYPESANSAADMQNVVRSLNDALEQADNLDSALVVHLGFSELRFLLESLEDEGGMAKQVTWFSSDSTFDDSSIPTSLRENEDFGPLPLMGLQYLGFHVENSIEVRSELLRRVFQETGSVSFEITFVHDAAMLMYLTLEKMGTLVEEHALFPSSLKAVSEISYGASGYLGLTDVGFRGDNEYLAGMAIPPNDSTFNSIWIADRLLKSVGSGTFDNRNFFIDTVKYLILENLQVPCDDYTIVGQTFDYLGRPIDFEFEFSIEETENNNLYIPLFFSNSFDVTCSDSRRFAVSCPPNARESFMACRGSVLEESNKKYLPGPPQQFTQGTQPWCNNKCPNSGPPPGGPATP